MDPFLGGPPDSFFDPPEPRIEKCPPCDGTGKITQHDMTVIHVATDNTIFCACGATPQTCDRCDGAGEVILTQEEIEDARNAALDSED